MYCEVLREKETDQVDKEKLRRNAWGDLIMQIHRRPTNTFLNVSVRNLEIFKIVVGKVVVEI